MWSPPGLDQINRVAGRRNYLRTRNLWEFFIYGHGSLIQPTGPTVKYITLWRHVLTYAANHIYTRCRICRAPPIPFSRSASPLSHIPVRNGPTPLVWPIRARRGPLGLSQEVSDSHPSRRRVVNLADPLARYWIIHDCVSSDTFYRHHHHRGRHAGKHDRAHGTMVGCQHPTIASRRSSGGTASCVEPRWRERWSRHVSGPG